MAMKDIERRKELVKSMTLVEKIKYYLYYYKVHLIIGIILIWGGSVMINGIINQKDIVISAKIINVKEIKDSNTKFLEELTTAVQLEEETQRLEIDINSYLNYEEQDTTHINQELQMDTMIGIGQLDIIATDETTFRYIAQNDKFVDLYQVLTEEQILELEPYFYYIDAYAYEEKYEAMEDTSVYYVFPEYNAHSKEGMRNPIAIGIYVQEDMFLRDCYELRDGEVVVGLVNTGERLENALICLEVMLENEL